MLNPDCELNELAPEHALNGRSHRSRVCVADDSCVYSSDEAIEGGLMVHLRVVHGFTVNTTDEAHETVIQNFVAVGCCG